MYPEIPMLLSQKAMTILALSHLKLQLTTDFAGAVLRYALSRSVADIILSFTIEEITWLAEQAERVNVIRVANPNSTAFWQDLKMSVANRDKSAVNLALVQSLLMGAPASPVM